MKGVSMNRFYSSADVGVFICIKDNGDGTGDFLREYNPGDPPQIILPERRAIKLNWSQMRECRQ